MFPHSTSNSPSKSRPLSSSFLSSTSLLQQSQQAKAQVRILYLMTQEQA